MKKIALLLAILLLVATPIKAQAATPREAIIMPSLTFTGTTANCSVRIVGDASNDYIEATIKLRSVSSVIQTWYIMGTGFIDWEDTAQVTAGRYYMLTVDVIINDIPIGQVFADGSCN